MAVELLSESAFKVYTVSQRNEKGELKGVADPERKQEFVFVHHDDDPTQIAMVSLLDWLVGRNTPVVKKNQALFDELGVIIEAGCDWYFDLENTEFVVLHHGWKFPDAIIAAMWPDETSVYHDVKTNPYIQAFNASPLLHGNIFNVVFPDGIPSLATTFEPVREFVEEYWGQFDKALNLHQFEATAVDIRRNILDILKEEEKVAIRHHPEGAQKQAVINRLHNASQSKMSSEKRVTYHHNTRKRTHNITSAGYVLTAPLMVDDDNQPLCDPTKTTEIIVSTCPYIPDAVHNSDIIKWLVGEQPELIERANVWFARHTIHGEWVVIDPNEHLFTDELFKAMWPAPEQTIYQSYTTNPYYLNFRDNPAVKGNLGLVFHPDGVPTSTRDSERFDKAFSSYNSKWVGSLNLHQLEALVLSFNDMLSKQLDEFTEHHLKACDAPFEEKEATRNYLKSARHR
jgi:hypothetical protein